MYRFRVCSTVYDLLYIPSLETVVSNKYISRYTIDMLLNNLPAATIVL